MRMGAPLRVAVLFLAAVVLHGCSLYVDRHRGGATRDGAVDANADSGDAASSVCGVCEGEARLCDEGSRACVACLSDDDCQDTEAGHCVAGECGICGKDEHCEHFDDAHRQCDPADGACVGCSVATEAADCGEFTCDPSTRQCTTVERNTLDPCEPCVSDTQCKSANGTESRCVPTNFMGMPHGTYCLSDRTTMANDACVSPLGGPVTLTSVGGVKASYCAPNFAVTTCELVLQFGDTCDDDDDCGAPGKEDGLCRDEGGTSRCTYGCTFGTDCPTGRSCVQVSPKYCCVAPNC
jgi:hypothetical protein